MPLRNPLALLGLLSIIPLIIIYLIRPKPKELPFSSLQFLREGEAERSAVLSRMIFDPLFWVQLLVLSSLSFAAAGPYITEEGVASSHIVLVIDASASMEASFSRVESLAGGYLRNYEKISIIEARSQPAVLLDHGSSAEARDILAKLKPYAVVADLSSALNRAAGMISETGGDILLVSDFISWKGDDPNDVRKLLQANGKINIVFQDSWQGGDNVAIVDGWDVPGPGYADHTSLIHNYGPARTAPITVSGPGGTSSKTAQLSPGSDYYFEFTAYPGINEISLDVDDAVSSDNHAYVYVPDYSGIDVLFLGDRGPAFSALRALPGANIKTSGEFDEFDLVVLSKNATFSGELNRYIDAGGRVIYVAQDLQSPDFIPVRISGEESGASSLWQRNKGFLEGLHMEEVGLLSYPSSSARRNSVTLVEAGGVPVLSYWRLGQGIVVYDGLELNSDFYQRPEYPIFWYQMTNWIAGVPDIKKSNLKTGTLVPLGGYLEVVTPSGPISTANLLLDEVGIYRFRGEIVSSNLYDPSESSLKRNRNIAAGVFLPKSHSQIRETEMANWVILLAALALLAELIILYRRRDA